MHIRHIDTGMMHPTRNASFVAFYTDPEFIYQSHPECRSWGEDVWNTKAALLGIVMRWNGELGFVGGMVDDGESLTQAVTREVAEEVGYTIDPSLLVPICSHEIVELSTDLSFKPMLHTHLYAYLVTLDQIYEIQSAASTAVCGRLEAAGFNVAHVVDGALLTLLRCRWAGSGASELLKLVESGLIKPAVVVPE